MKPAKTLKTVIRRAVKSAFEAINEDDFTADWMEFEIESGRDPEKIKQRIICGRVERAVKKFLALKGDSHGGRNSVRRQVDGTQKAKRVVHVRS